MSDYCYYISATCSVPIYSQYVLVINHKAVRHFSYLVTTLKMVPRGTEGAISVVGTFAGLVASILLASIGCLMGEVKW